MMMVIMARTDFWNTNCILKVIAGSHSYGMETSESDIDYRGVCIPPASYLIGLDQFEHHETKKPDCVIYSLKKFVKLALDNNPNIIDVLFVKKEHIIHMDLFGYELRRLGDLFLSKKIYKTYGGYAYSRLKNLTEKKKNPIGNKANLINKYGYDTKDAAHLIRLMKMAIEILRDGEVNVYRPDRKELLKIRNGEYTLEQIIEMYNQYNEILNDVYKKSTLSEEPHYEIFNDWLIEVQSRFIKDEIMKK
jgi:predicted nucleotidyltransferase